MASIALVTREFFAVNRVVFMTVSPLSKTRVTLVSVFVWQPQHQKMQPAETLATPLP